MREDWRIDAGAFRRSLLKWYDCNHQSWPWRLDWQRTGDPYFVWISEIMLQQTVIKAVLPVYQRFLSELPTIVDLARASEEDVRRLVRGLGYYRRFAMLHRAAQQLVKLVGTEQRVSWPKSASEWQSLPGIGVYTSAAIASITLNEVKPVVDGNVERVLCRLYDIRKPVNLPQLKRIYYETAGQLVDQKRPGDFNQAMMELGQRVCTPTKPDCAACSVQRWCLAFANASQAQAPLPKLRKEKKKVKMRLFIPSFQDQVLISPRSESAHFLKGTAGFVTAIFQDNVWVVDHNDMDLESIDKNSVLLGKFRHSITHNDIEAEVFKVEVPNLRSKLQRPGANWKVLNEIEPSLVANLDRKAWRIFERAKLQI